MQRAGVSRASVPRDRTVTPGQPLTRDVGGEWVRSESVLSRRITGQHCAEEISEGVIVCMYI